MGNATGAASTAAAAGDATQAAGKAETKAATTVKANNEEATNKFEGGFEKGWARSASIDKNTAASSPKAEAEATTTDQVQLDFGSSEWQPSSADMQQLGAVAARLNTLAQTSASKP